MIIQVILGHNSTPELGYPPDCCPTIFPPPASAVIDGIVTGEPVTAVDAAHTPSTDIAHRFTLDTDQVNLHGSLMAELTQEPAMKTVMNTLLAVGDKGTWRHCYRVGSLMVACGLLMEMSLAETKLAGRIGLGHDIGKSHPAIQEVIHDPRPKTPGMFAVIKQHVGLGVTIARQAHLNSNVQQGIGCHHALQLVQPYSAYPLESLAPIEEADGRSPDLRLLIGLVACCDVYDAVTIEKSLGARRYQATTLPRPLTRSEIANEIDSLRATKAAKVTILAVTT